MERYGPLFLYITALVPFRCDAVQGDVCCRRECDVDRQVGGYVFLVGCSESKAF